jgi:hypothetical protein
MARRDEGVKLTTQLCICEFVISPSLPDILIPILERTRLLVDAFVRDASKSANAFLIDAYRTLASALGKMLNKKRTITFR